MPIWATILVTIITAGGSGGGLALAVKAWVERDREPALIAKLTAEANRQIYESYSELLNRQSNDAKLARDEARAAREEAQEARLRAAAAEIRAAGAEARATAAEATLTEMSALVRQHVPDAAEELLRRFEALVRQPSLAMQTGKPARS